MFADENSAPIGDPILQPGPLDINCSNDIKNSIGTLAAFVPIDFLLGSFNRVDAAVAKVTAATVSNSTPSGAYGMPNSHIIPARLGMKVQKMGRTTVHTTGRVTAPNFFGFIGYAAGPVFFVNQVEIRSFTTTIDPMTGMTIVTPKPFGGPGDSGSLVVTTYGKNPVALLFAGSALFIIANPIDMVLDELGQALGQKLTIDGTRSNAVPTGTAGR